MVINGHIGSKDLHYQQWEANYLQELAYKSKLKIPLLIGIDAIHGNALYKGATVYPSPITIAVNNGMMKNSYLVGLQTAFEMRLQATHWAFYSKYRCNERSKMGKGLEKHLVKIHFSNLKWDWL